MTFLRSRFAPVLASCLLVVLAAGACGSVSSDAFDVEGRTTSQREFDRELDALVDNEQFVELYEQTGESVRDSEGTVSAELTATWASFVIQQEIMAAAAEDDDVEVGDDERAAAEQSAAELFGGEEVFGEFPEWFRERVIERSELQNAYFASAGATPTDDEVRAFYDENLAALVQGCPSGKFPSHILVASEEEANAVLEQLAGGAPFEEVAAERSTDPSGTEQGGFLDCFQEGQYVAEFEAAVVATSTGETTGAVQTEFGWHVIKVDAEPSFEALRTQIESNLASGVQQDAARTLFEDADVEVDPRYGAWVVDEQGARVEPPEPKVPESTEPPVPSTGLAPPSTTP